MRLIWLLMVVACSLTVQGQSLVSGRVTVPYDHIYLTPPYYIDFSGRGDSEGSISARAFYWTKQAPGSSLCDTLIITNRCKDDFIIQGLGLETSKSFEVHHGYQDFLPIDSIYYLKTSRLWQRRNGGEAFSYMDFHARLIVRDLGLHDARLINRTARSRKDMLLEKQVRVLLVEEFLEMTPIRLSTEVKR